MPTARPLITLLTDFGDRDYFVASMKGVILSIHPDVHIVDLSHQIASYQIEEAGYMLYSCYRSFPEGTCSRRSGARSSVSESGTLLK